MNSTLVEQVANAVLYEGYLLYPYRPSALKNRKRANFGVVYPGGSMRTQCVVAGDDRAAIDVKVRFLRLTGEGEWQKAIECTVTMPDCSLAGAACEPQRETFAFPLEIEGAIEVSAERAKGAFRVAVRISNLTSAGNRDEEEALAASLVSTHTILFARNGEFVSLLDPPDVFRDIVAACDNAGTWPVLVGEAGQRDTMLSSPIILYDYPRIAPETAGDLYDATEIDEMLALRILTLTDDEKSEMRSVDPRARRILERTERLSQEHLLRLHATMRKESL